MSLIPFHLGPLETHIHADCRLAFQVLTAFGAAQGSDASSKALSREGNRLLVEFHTPARGLLGRRMVYRTVEWVTLHEPEQVEFETVEGPLSMKRDSFTLVEQGGCTNLQYKSECGVKGWVAGWLLGVLYVRPAKKRLMREHLLEMKETIETRARSSRVFPQQPCIWEEPDDRSGA